MSDVDKIKILIASFSLVGFKELRHMSQKKVLKELGYTVSPKYKSKDLLKIAKKHLASMEETAEETIEEPVTEAEEPLEEVPEEVKKAEKVVKEPKSLLTSEEEQEFLAMKAKKAKKIKKAEKKAAKAEKKAEKISKNTISKQNRKIDVSKLPLPSEVNSIIPNILTDSALSSFVSDKANVLQRALVVCNDPTKAGLPGEIIRVANSVISSIAFTIQFNNKPSYYPTMLLNVLRDVQYNQWYTYTDKKSGKEISKYRQKDAYTITLLDDISRKELKEIADRQKALEAQAED